MKHKSLFVRHLHFTRSRGETNLASPRAEVPRNSLIINDTRRAVICIIEWHLQQDRQERATSAKTSRIGKNEQLRQKQAGLVRAPRSLARQKRKIYLFNCIIRKSNNFINKIVRFCKANILQHFLPCSPANTASQNNSYIPSWNSSPPVPVRALCHTY